MLIYFFMNSQFARGIWASLCSGFTTISAYALYVLIFLLGMSLVIGAVANRSVEKTTKGFMGGLKGIAKAVVTFIAVKCIWKFICWIAKQVKNLWSWINKNLQKGFKKYVAAGPAKVLSSIFATLIIILVILII